MESDTHFGAKTLRIGKREAFSLDELNQLIEVVYKLTEKAVAQCDQLLLSANRATGFERTQFESMAIEARKTWEGKMRRLGGVPNGAWIVDFDSGSGYFCWKYPERIVSHWHGYADGFTKRKQIAVPGLVQVALVDQDADHGKISEQESEHA